MTSKVLFDYNSFSGTTEYHYNNQIAPLLYWTDGVNAILMNNETDAIIKIVNHFLELLIEEQLAIPKSERDMMLQFQSWHLICNHKNNNIDFYCQADTGMPRRCESIIRGGASEAVTRGNLGLKPLHRLGFKLPFSKVIVHQD
jgi:hypothetical protein